MNRTEKEELVAARLVGDVRPGSKPQWVRKQQSGSDV